MLMNLLGIYLMVLMKKIENILNGTETFIGEMGI